MLSVLNSLNCDIYFRNMFSLNSFFGGGGRVGLWRPLYPLPQKGWKIQTQKEICKAHKKMIIATGFYHFHFGFLPVKVVKNV
jgi:hypothetical protein